MGTRLLWGVIAWAGICLGAGAQEITVVKTANPSGDVAPGGRIDYQVQIHNPFNSDLPISFFSDLIPDNTRYIGGTLTLDPFVDGVLFYYQGEVFNIGDLLLPAQGTTTIAFSVRLDTGLAPGTQILNQADTEYGSSNVTANTVIAQAELVNVLDVDPPGVIGPGEVITYTLTLLNFGYAPATNVSILAPVPALTSFEPGSIHVTGATGNVVFDSSGGGAVSTDPAGLTIAALGEGVITYQMRVDSPLPDDSVITHVAYVDGEPTNQVENFTRTLSDYIDLETTPGNVVVRDLGTDDLTGFALAGCDFDNDGKGDLIIGDPLANNEGTRSGVVHIVYGGFLLSDSVTLPNTGAATTQIYPPQGAHLFGISLATGDFTGDGLPDILVGAPGQTAYTDAGQAFVIAGGAYHNIIDLSNPGTPPASVINGADAEWLGRSVAAGDFNGDGFSDLILGGPTFGPESPDLLRGRVWVVRGGSALPSVVNLSSPPPGTSRIIGRPEDRGIASAFDGVETPLAAGDVNGDHLDDIIIGAPIAPTPEVSPGLGGAQSGKVFVVRGTTATGTLDLSGAPQGWTEIQSHFPAGRMGQSVTVGDYNGDGFDDVGIGAPLASWLLTPGDIVYSQAGVVFMIPGRSNFGDGVMNLFNPPRGLVTLFGEYSQDYLGWAVTSGDYNGDGLSDLLMGAPYAYNNSFIPNGAAFLLLGSLHLRPQYLFPFVPNGVLRFYADDGGDLAFRSLATGDLNSDGFADLFLGDYVSDPATKLVENDETHVFFGKPRAPRIELAVASEFGVANRVLNAGEQLVLQFDQQVDVTPGPVQPEDFFLTNPGASLGSQATLAANPNDPTQAIITLGSDFSNLVIDGYSGDTSTNIDIGASFPPGLITGVDNNLTAEDTGFINTDDRGIDLLWVHQTIPVDVPQSTGGMVNVAGNTDRNRPDFAYTRHELDVPANSLSRDTNFAFGRPPASLGNLGLRTAVQVLDDDPSVPTFSSPATLTLQYREEDLALTPGAVESLFRIYQVITPGTAGADVGRAGIVRMQTGHEMQLVSGTQTIDTENNTVTVEVNSLNPESSGGEVGVFATLPVNPVEERSTFVKPASAGASVVITAASTALQAGPAGAYTLHQIEFPNFAPASQGDPGSFQIKLRSPNLFERTLTPSPTANRFPAQSGALFAVETRNASGSLAAFTSPVNIRVQFIPRAAATDTDVVDFSGAVGDPQQMRFVHSDFDLTSGADFQFSERPQAIDTSAGTVTIQSFAGLTGGSGMSLCGAVVDMRVTPLTAGRLVDIILGRVTPSPSERASADLNGDGDIDVADLVRLVNGD